VNGPANVSIIVRSIVFNVLFYLNILVHLVGALPTFVMPYPAIVAVGKSWGRTNLWLLKAICGIDVKFSGVEIIPPGPLIVAGDFNVTPWSQHFRAELERSGLSDAAAGHGHPCRPQHGFGALLVHGERRGQHAGMGVGEL